MFTVPDMTTYYSINIDNKEHQRNKRVSPTIDVSYKNNIHDLIPVPFGQL